MLEHLGLNVRRLRRARDLTQTQLARFVGISQPRLSAIELGLRPPSVLIDRLADALGVSPGDLLRTPPSGVSGEAVATSASEAFARG